MKKVLYQRFEDSGRTGGLRTAAKKQKEKNEKRKKKKMGEKMKGAEDDKN